MSNVILDPSLWESVEAGGEAWIEEWLVTEGDHVQAGQPLARANLLGAHVDVPAPNAGVLEQIVVDAGDRFAPGAVLARLVPI